MSTGACCSALDELACMRDLRGAYQLNAMPTQRANTGTRRKREFTPDELKDSNYWLKRNRNNEAAKKSRQRKRMEEHLLETRAVELQRENDELKAALSAVNHHSTAPNHPAAFSFGLPNDRYPSFSATLIPMQHCPFSGCCRCPQTNHLNSVFDMVSYTVPNTSATWRTSASDGYHPVSRHGDGTNACTSGAYWRNTSFAHGNDSGLPDYRSAPTNQSRCYGNSKTPPLAQSYARQAGQIGATRGGAMRTNGETKKSVLLPHKLRYKVDNARFASAYFSS